MKIIILSDSHGNIVRLRHVLGYAQELKAGAIVHAGDWYRAAPEDFARVKTIPIYTVLGNNDYRPELRDELRLAGIKYSENFLGFEIGNIKIGLSHYPIGIKEALESQKYDLLIHGHTHKIKDETHGKTRVLNPGALHKTPEPSFAVFDTKTNKVEFIDVED